MGHEFWITVENSTIVALTVLTRTTPIGRILYLHVADSHENLGIGSAPLRTVFEAYPESEFVVIPLEGTEEFYRRLGFMRTGRWKRLKPSSLRQ